MTSRLGRTPRSMRLDVEGDCSEYYVTDLDSTNGTLLRRSQGYFSAIASGRRQDQGRKPHDEVCDARRVRSGVSGTASSDDAARRVDRDCGSRRSLLRISTARLLGALRRAVPGRSLTIMMDLDYFKKGQRRPRPPDSEATRFATSATSFVTCWGAHNLAARYGGEEYLGYIVGPRE